MAAEYSRLQPYKCSICKSEGGCGDDKHTFTQYSGPELAAGDRLKLILLQANDLITYDNFQIYEVKALINALIDEHFEEENLNE